MKRTALACTLTGIATVATAQMLPVTADAAFTFNGQDFVISRASTLSQPAIDTLNQISATCEAPCLSPMTVAENVATFGELDVITFLSTDVEAGDGLLIDARLPEARAGGFIPASVNVPAATVSPANPYRDDILAALGAREFQGISNFDDVLSLVVYDSGPATTDAQSLITDLLDAGYPADKIAYYRGGMQVWSVLGLTTEGVVQ